MGLPRPLRPRDHRAPGRGSGGARDRGPLPTADPQKAPRPARQPAGGRVGPGNGRLRHQLDGQGARRGRRPRAVAQRMRGRASRLRQSPSRSSLSPDVATPGGREPVRSASPSPGAIAGDDLPPPRARVAPAVERLDATGRGPRPCCRRLAGQMAAGRRAVRSAIEAGRVPRSGAGHRRSHVRGPRTDADGGPVGASTPGCCPALAHARPRPVGDLVPGEARSLEALVGRATGTGRRLDRRPAPAAASRRQRQSPRSDRQVVAGRPRSGPRRRGRRASGREAGEVVDRGQVRAPRSTVACQVAIETGPGCRTAKVRQIGARCRHGARAATASATSTGRCQRRPESSQLCTSSRLCAPKLRRVTPAARKPARSPRSSGPGVGLDRHTRRRPPRPCRRSSRSRSARHVRGRRSVTACRRPGRRSSRAGRPDGSGAAEVAACRKARRRAGRARPSRPRRTPRRGRSGPRVVRPV